MNDIFHALIKPRKFNPIEQIHHYILLDLKFLIYDGINQYGCFSKWPFHVASISISIKIQKNTHKIFRNLLQNI